MNKMDLSAKTALVTDGNNGVGKEICIRLASSGANICFTYTSDSKEALETEKELKDLGVNVAAIQANRQGLAGIEKLIKDFKRVLSEWGLKEFDILVNNTENVPHSSFGTATEEEVDAQFDGSYKSVFFLSQNLSSLIKANGRIINIGSGANQFSIPDLMVYEPIKIAVELFTQYLAQLLRPREITVNAIAPGDSEMNSADQLGIGEETQNIGDFVSYLCSDEANQITGKRIEVAEKMFA